MFSDNSNRSFSRDLSFGRIVVLSICYSIELTVYDKKEKGLLSCFTSLL
jgi:hypothetical protein